MSLIKVRCIDQTLRFENTPVIASGDRAVDFVGFEFCSKWDGYIRTAVFWRTDGVPYHVLLDENDICEIPKEVMVQEGLVYFGAFGIKTPADQHERPPRRTTEVLTYRIVKGAITTGTQPSDPTPAIYDQLLARYAELAAKYMELHDAMPYKADLVDGKIPASQLPAFVDDVLEYENKDAFPVPGESGKLYVDLDTNLTYRWSGSTYVEVSASLALGETASTAYRGDRGKAAYDHTLIINGNPHGTTAEQTGAVPTSRTINGRSLATDLRLPIIEVSEEKPEDPQDGDVWLDLSDDGAAGVVGNSIHYTTSSGTESTSYDIKFPFDEVETYYREIYYGDFILDASGTLWLVEAISAQVGGDMYVECNRLTSLAGPKGDTGDAGYTPERGKDYWTDEDKVEIVASVLTEFERAESASF